jgi:hypothetical protein
LKSPSPPSHFLLSPQDDKGLANSVPIDSSLGCILNYWECFDPANLKKECLIHYFSEVWPNINWGLKGGMKMEVLIMVPSYS